IPFHVFLSHSNTDKPAVEELARRLAKEGIQAWLDKWHLIPGDPWQPAIEKALAESETCAVFVGPSGFGPWQNEEMRAAKGTDACWPAPACPCPCEVALTGIFFLWRPACGGSSVASGNRI